MERKYKYEVHLHSALSSACAQSTGAEYVRAYKQAGFDGIFITDHFFLGNTCIDRSLPWEIWVHRFCDSWREAYEEGCRIGLKVFFAWESTYESEDFLIYGLDEDWLIRHPEIMTWNQEEQYYNVHKDGGLVVQAHPFRERWYQSEVKLHPHHCDAFEVSNGGNRAYMDALAYHYALEHDIPMTSGSDMHNVSKFDSSTEFCMYTETPLNSASDYVSLILSGSGFSFCAPDERFTSEHKKSYFDVFEYSQNGTRAQIRYEPWEDAPYAEKP